MTYIPTSLIWGVLWEGELTVLLLAAELNYFLLKNYILSKIFIRFSIDGCVANNPDIFLLKGSDINNGAIALL